MSFIPSSLAVDFKQQRSAIICCSKNVEVNIDDNRVVPAEAQRIQNLFQCLMHLCCCRDFEKENTIARHRFLESIAPKVDSETMEHIIAHPSWQEGKGPLLVKDIKQLQKIAECYRLTKLKETYKPLDQPATFQRLEKAPPVFKTYSQKTEQFYSDKIANTLGLTTNATGQQIQEITKHIEQTVTRIDYAEGISSTTIQTLIIDEIVRRNIQIHSPNEI